MSTKRKGDSCYDKAGMDEPIFVLRAQDRLAARIVRVWASDARMVGTPESKILEAFDIADQMDAWRNRKIPD